MGLLEAPKSDSAKQLAAGTGKDDSKGDAKAADTGTGLTPEDIKELEDLDLSELDKK